MQYLVKFLPFLLGLLVPGNLAVDSEVGAVVDITLAPKTTSVTHLNSILDYLGSTTEEKQNKFTTTGEFTTTEGYATTKETTTKEGSTTTEESYTTERFSSGSTTTEETTTTEESYTTEGSTTEETTTTTKTFDLISIHPKKLQKLQIS